MNKNTIIKRQLLHSIKRGTGEAYLIVKNNPDIDFSSQIIKGIYNIYAYDGQSEGNRAQYIFDLIAISNQKDKMRLAILSGLASEPRDTWNLNHLYALAKLFAQKNDLELKQAMYNRFLNHPIEDSDWVGAYEILALDGIDGLFYIAEKYGKYIEKHPDYYLDDYLIRDFKVENPTLKVDQALENRAKTNPFIQLYLDQINRTKQSHNMQPEKSAAFENIMDEVLNCKSFIRYNRRKKLNNVQIDILAKQLLIEKDKVNIAKLLRVFTIHKFPYDPNFILDLAKKRGANNYQIVQFATEALKHLKSKDIRNFALDKIKTSKNLLDYLAVLVSNYQKGDAKLLVEIATNTSNEFKVECLAGIYTDIYNANNTKECQQPLEILYGKMNCAIHRNGIINILINNHALSDKIKEEITYDCFQDTRKLALELDGK